MKTNKFEAESYSQNELSIAQQKEMSFIYNHFMNYTRMNDIRPGKLYDPEYRIHMFYQVLEYTKGLFTLPQLYSIYNSIIGEGGVWNYDQLNELKSRILKGIDVYHYPMCVKTIEKDNFKQQIIEINPIILNVLVDLIFCSELFYDRETEEHRMPEILNNEIVYEKSGC